MGFGEEDELSFNTLTKHQTRSEAAKVFYDLLVLKSKSLVDIQQQMPRGDIAITSTSLLESDGLRALEEEEAEREREALVDA